MNNLDVLLRNLRQNAFIALTIAKKNFLSQYAGSAFGFAWAFIQPLALALIYAFLFKNIFKVTIETSPAQGGLPIPIDYTVWLFSALLPWTLFADTVSNCAESVVNNAVLATKTILSLEILPVAAFLNCAAKHAIGLVILAGLMAVTATRPGPALLALPLFFLSCMLLSLGLGFFVAALNVYLRDTAQVIQVLLQVLFFATPIFYRPDMFPATYRAIILANPLSYVVEGYRLCCIGPYGSPQLFQAGPPLAYFVAVCVLLPLLGSLFFKRLKSGFADVM